MEGCPRLGSGEERNTYPACTLLVTRSTSMLQPMHSVTPLAIDQYHSVPTLLICAAAARGPVETTESPIDHEFVGMICNFRSFH